MLTISILGILEPDLASQMKPAFLFLPNYCFGQGISDLYNNYESLHLLEKEQTIDGYTLDFCQAASINMKQDLTITDCCTGALDGRVFIQPGLEG